MSDCESFIARLTIASHRVDYDSCQYAKEGFDSVVYVHDLVENANDIEVSHILGSAVIEKVS